MHTPLALPLAVATLLLAAPLLPGQKPEKPISPVTLVSRAETLIKKGDKEDATMLLWQALDLLRGREHNAIEAATWLSARYLAKENDPLEMQRREVFTQVASKQVALAKSYRIKKWYDTAATRLEVGTMYDPNAVKKERRALNSKTKGKTAAARRAAADAAPATPQPVTSKLLLPDATQAKFGPWEQTDDGLRLPGHPLQMVGMREWLCKAANNDNEVIVEVKPDDPKMAWNAGIAIGTQYGPGVVRTGYRVILQHMPESKKLFVYIVYVAATELLTIADVGFDYPNPRDGYHRFAVRINGASIQAMVDNEAPVKVQANHTTYGLVALLHGVRSATSCGIRFRNLRIDPLPADQPTDEELRQQTLEKNQHKVTTSVEEARKLMASRKREPAALRLREALLQLRELPEGILRTNLQKSITAMLSKADPLAKKRAAAAKLCAQSLGQLADKYASDGRPRLGRMVAQHAKGFDAASQTSRIGTIDKAIAAWNATQLISRAAELAPPRDDGAMLRKWFSGGRRLDNRGREWIVQGPSARVENLANGATFWMPKIPTKATLVEGTFGVHMRLPAFGCQGGVCFDAAGPHDFSVAMLSRRNGELQLRVSRWAGGRWMRLAQRRILLDAWRLETWHAITVTMSKAGIKVQAYDATISLKRERLGDPNGRIGLFAGNHTEEEATIELRAFHAKAK